MAPRRRRGDLRPDRLRNNRRCRASGRRRESLGESCGALSHARIDVMALARSDEPGATAVGVLTDLKPLASRGVSDHLRPDIRAVGLAHSMRP